LGKTKRKDKTMQNYNDLVVNTLIETSTTNLLKVVSYEKTSENNKTKKVEEFAFNICHVAEQVYFADCEIKQYTGKDKKAFKIATFEKYQIDGILSQVGKNDVKALKTIGEKAEEFFNEFQNSETKANSIRGFAKLVKKENEEKTIQQKIEAFIKSNTTKKADDNKLTIAEFTAEFSQVAQKMLKEKNSNIVTFNDDISKDITKVTDKFLNEVGKLDQLAMNK
jgi:hypothetical protein